MKRIIACLAVLALLAATFAGCSNVPENTVFAAADMAGKVIGVQEGTTGDTLVTWDYEDGGAEILRYKAGADAILALKQGKVDCVVIDREPAKVFVEKNKGIKILEEEFADEDYAICIAKDKTELLEDINAALKQLKENGTLQKIIVNYIGDEATGDEAKGSYQYKSPEGIKRENGKFIMATNAEFPPYEYIENSKIVGLDVDMAQAIADILGKELVVENMHFDSIVAAVQSGKADVGIAGMTVTEDRLKSVNFSDSYTSSQQVIIVRD